MVSALVQGECSVKNGAAIGLPTRVRHAAWHFDSLLGTTADGITAAEPAPFDRNTMASRTTPAVFLERELTT